MIRFRLVISVIGIILQGFSALMAIPVIVAMLMRQNDSVFAFLLCLLTGMLFGRLAWRASSSKDFDDLNRMEGIVAASMSWIAVATAGAIPYMCFGMGFVDALFESMSGFTTTGATVLFDYTVLNGSMFFYRGYTQWIGGMGILVLFVAVLPHLAISGRQLFFAETSSASQEKLTPRISDTARRLWGWYFFLTALMSAMLYFTGMPLNDAVSNSFGTLAAGGFSPHPLSIMGYENSAAEWVTIVFMFLAGANFTLQVKCLHGNFASFFRNPEFRLYLTIVLVSSLLLVVVLTRNNAVTGSIVDALRIAMFQNISIMTTTGSATADFELWSGGAKSILLVLMFIGGCSGSAGGGPKVVRILLLFRYLGKVLLKIVQPNAVVTVKLARSTFKESEVQPVFSFVVLYFLFFAIGGTIATLIENDFTVGFTGAIATLGNIGPGFGKLGPMGSFYDLNWFTKVLYTFLMWAGRLEIMAVAVFFRQELWRDSKW
ncbi:MAG TPA: TrkH family potassium uptake protein [Candidatus Rifleibacterium sp.]|nr:TrkH family potassium uptake protein [Candidatus Rifleibacterium sp.]